MTAKHGKADWRLTEGRMFHIPMPPRMKTVIYICYDFSRYGKRQICVAQVNEKDILDRRTGISSDNVQIANQRP